ncbi:MAG: helix-turn-helix transcriptional regulator, partial [Acidimicrobiales bacterium]|nr:helix-turn-helix transcriptional regulator [Acidimicrobiales bacterium]
FERAESFAGGDPARTVRISNERALLEVRDQGPGYLERALATAEAAAPHGGLAELRAQSTLGAALLYSGSPEWEPVLRSALAKIAAVGEPELESATAFHLVSGLGLHGRLREAIEVAGVQVDRARVAGLGSWVTHLEQVWFTHRGVTSAGLQTMIADAEAHLATHQLGGARNHVHFGRTLAELDLGRFDDARHSLAQMVAESTGAPDETAMIATVRSELAWFVDDLEMAAYALEEGRSSDGAYFGLQTLVERTVAYVFVRHGEPFEPRYPSFTMPMWWSAIHEIQGLVALAAGDTRTAADELRCAFEHASAVGIPRWIARVGIVASDAGADLRSEAIDTARRAGLVGVLRRLGISTRPELTFTEESVLRRIAAGETSRQAATALGIAPGTVDQHVESARRKLGAATRFEAAVLVT